jgi:hypothetical protein
MSTIVEKHLDGIEAAGLKLYQVEYVLLCKEEQYGRCRKSLQQQLHKRGIWAPTISRAPVKVPFDKFSELWYTRGPIRAMIHGMFAGG